MNKTKKNLMRVCSLLITTMMIICLSSVSSLAAINFPGNDYTITKVFSDLDFESGEINPSDFYSYDASTKGGYGLSVVTDPDTGSYVLKNQMTSEDITYNGNQITITQSNWQINYPKNDLRDTDINDHLVMEFDLKTENFNYTIRTMYVGSATVGKDIYCVGPLIQIGTGKIINIGGGESGITITPNQWYKFKFDFDVPENTLDFYLDGELIQENYELSEDFDGFTYFNLPRFMALYKGNVGTLYIDNCRLYTATEKYIVSASTLKGDEEVEGLNAFPVSGASVKLDFSEKMGEITKEMFSFTANGINKAFDFRYDSEDGTVIITPTEPFKGREECKISFDQILTENGGENAGENFVEFSVSSPDYGIKDVTMPAFVPGEDATVEVCINNTSANDRSEMLLVGIYKGNQLLSVGAASTQNLAGEEKSFDVTLSVHSDYTEDDCTVRIYLVKPGTLYRYDSIKY